jgi:hypothetical protein
MRSLITSNIIRTTIDLDPTVLEVLRRRSKQQRKSMGQLASELLAPALAESETPPRAVRWATQAAGRPRVDLEDKDRVWQILDRGRGADADG